MIYKNYSTETGEEFISVGFDSIEEMQEAISAEEVRGKVLMVLPDYYEEDDSDYEI